MYTHLLAEGNREFENAVTLDFNLFKPFQSKGDALRHVIQSVTQCQAGLDKDKLITLRDRLHTWRTDPAGQYAERGAKQGVGYRLWMEVKQLLKNNHDVGQPANYSDPNMPADCPGTVLLGTYVPPGDGVGEICHQFSYRWLVASGRLRLGGHEPHAGPWDGINMQHILFPVGKDFYDSAREQGAMQVRAGDLIGVFDARDHSPIPLSHSLIVQDAATWFGANNLTCFGIAPGRSAVNIGNYDARWIDNPAPYLNPDQSLKEEYWRAPNWRGPAQEPMVMVYRRGAA